jgi:hypothetical protein
MTGVSCNLMHLRCRVVQLMLCECACCCSQDLLARLSGSLSCIEQYAVRFLESLRPVDVEAAAAAAVEDIKQEEWELDAIEKRKEQQVGRSRCLWWSISACYGPPRGVGDYTRSMHTRNRLRHTSRSQVIACCAVLCCRL